MIREVAVLLLSIIILVAFFLDSYLVLTGNIKTADPQILLLIGNVSGGVQTLAGVVVTYWFGSTKSSSDKDKTIANMSSNEQPKTTGATI